MERMLCSVSELTQPRGGGPVAPARGAEPPDDDGESESCRAGELVGVSRESTVSARVVRALVEAVEQAGVSRERLLQTAPRMHERLEDVEGRVPRAESYRLCEVALELTGDPAFGLHWAERLTESSFLPVSNLIVHSMTWREGLEVLRQYSRLISDEVRYEIVERGDELIMRGLPLAGESLPLRRFLSEMLTVGFLNQIHQINVHARPKRVSFEYAAPAYQAEYERVFEQAVAFEQSYTGIVFDSKLLNVRSPYKDDDMREALHTMAEQRLMRITHRTPYALRVREILVREAWPNRTDMQSVARALGVSTRSLRRRLADEGKPYGEVLNEALAIVAKQLLRNDQRTIEEVSYAMGFADKSTFYRSFKRWTGTTPNAYRQTEREKE